jgi:ubiquinone/menaquinone biosynthesis C-methylase UbiE
MTRQRVNYNQIASEYDDRYISPSLEDRGKALVELAAGLQADQILEVGCGTGHWLGAMHSVTRGLYGLDASTGMLKRAHSRKGPLKLACGYARQLPFEDNFFDLVFCVHAIHHFGDPGAFIGEAFRVLRGGGALAIVSSDPHRRRDDWYIYQYFEGTHETDLGRFPAWEALSEWMAAHGFGRIELREVERVDHRRHGRGVFDDPFLGKNACSQLALLSEEAYAAGVRRIEAALREAEEREEPVLFRSEFSIAMLLGRKVAS